MTGFSETNSSIISIVNGVVLLQESVTENPGLGVLETIFIIRNIKRHERRSALNVSRTHFKISLGSFNRRLSILILLKNILLTSQRVVNSIQNESQVWQLVNILAVIANVDFIHKRHDFIGRTSNDGSASISDNITTTFAHSDILSSNENVIRSNQPVEVSEHLVIRELPRVSIFVSSTNRDFGIAIAFTRTHVEREDVVLHSFLNHQIIEQRVLIVRSHRRECKTHNTIEVRLCENTSLFFEDFNELLVSDFNVTEENGILREFSNEFTGSELNV